MATLNQIEEFMAATPVVLTGVSRNPKKFGQAAFKELKKKGLDIIPVNPLADEILGVKAYRDVKSMPAGVKGVIIMTKKVKTAGVVRDAREKGIKNIWMLFRKHK